MQEYRAYVLGPDGHITFRHDLRCADYEAAKERAKQLVDGHVIELWQKDCKLARSSRSTSKDANWRAYINGSGRMSSAETRPSSSLSWFVMTTASKG